MRDRDGHDCGGFVSTLRVSLSALFSALAREGARDRATGDRRVSVSVVGLKEDGEGIKRTAPSVNSSFFAASG